MTHFLRHIYRQTKERPEFQALRDWHSQHWSVRFNGILGSLWMQVAEGKRVGRGRFEVIAPLGEGGAGLVYEVRDRETNARLALKTVRLHSAPSALASLKREFRAVRDIIHPNLVRLDELFEEDGTWFFTMELVEGTRWLNYVRPPGSGRFDEVRLRAALIQTVEALSALHARGMVHRDIKPSNVLVSRDGKVKLLDFGITTSPETVGEQSSVVGTFAYMAPEQLMYAESTPASDFYSLGVMLYQALSGRLPFFEREASVMQEKLANPPTPVAEVAPDVPKDLAALCDALLRSRASERPDAAGILSLLGKRQAALAPQEDVFVGRFRELTFLRDAFETTKRGSAVTVVIQGTSGIGKTDLVREFIGTLAGEALVFSGKCHEREFVPYKGLDGIVDKLGEHLADHGNEVAETLDATFVQSLTRLFPVLRSVPAFEQALRFVGLPSEGEPSEVRLRSFRAFRELLRRLSERQKLVFWIDDSQWADADTLSLLAEVLVPPNAPPLLLVCSERTTNGSQQPLTATLLPGVVRRAQLQGLGLEDISLLATKIAGTQFSDIEIRTIAEESGGHPLFLRELLLHYRDRRERREHVELDRALWTRVLQLAAPERRIVEAAAVAGIPTPIEVIGIAAEIPSPELLEHIANLRGTRQVKVSRAAQARVIEPYHDRIREAVLSGLTLEARRDWQRRLSEALDQCGARDIDVQSAHWETVGERRRAVALYRETAERANSQLAFDRAVEFYRRALALLDGDAEERRDIEHALAEALANAGRGGEAGEAFVALARSETTRETAIELQSRAARAFLTSGRFEQGLLALRNAMAAVGLPFPESRFRILCLLIWYRLRLQLRGLALRRRPVSEQSPEERLKINVCWAAGHFPSMSHPIAGAVYHALGTRLSLDYGDPSLAIRALCGHANAMSTGGFKARNKTAEIVECIEVLRREVPSFYNDAFADGAKAFAAFMIEEWETAQLHCARAEVGFRDRCVGATYELATARLLYGRLLVWLGRIQELEAYAVPILRDALRRNDLYSVINTRATACVVVALAKDDVEQARYEVDETFAALSKSGFQLQHVYWLAAAAMVDLYCGSPDSVLERREAHDKALKQSLILRMPSQRSVIDALSARAHLQIAERGGRDRALHLRQAKRFAVELEAEGPEPSRAIGQVLEAGVFALEGKPELASQLLESAIQAFDRTYMILHAASARYALSKLVSDERARELVSEADQAFDAQRVVSPVRFAKFYAPGFQL